MLSLQLFLHSGVEPRPETGFVPTETQLESEAEPKSNVSVGKAVHPLASAPAPSFFSDQSLGAVSDGKPYLCAMLPLKRYRGMAHVHLKNLYMAFSYNENYRKMPVILECKYHYSSESSYFAFSAIKCFLIISFGVLRRCDFPAS